MADNFADFNLMNPPTERKNNYKPRRRKRKVRREKHAEGDIYNLTNPYDNPRNGFFIKLTVKF